MTAIREYTAPQTLDEAVRVAGESGVTVLAGGTDLHPRWSKEIVEKPAVIVDVKAIDQLRGVGQTDGEVSIGACAPLSEIASDPLIRAAAPVLADAAGRVACPQVRNRATIGGNLCNASPAADTAVPLILLDAMLELASASQDGVAVRQVAVSDFFRGPGETVLRPGEILTRIHLKPMPEDAFAAWNKFGTRPSMEIAVASVGVALRIEAGTVTQARVGYGSVAPVPLRGHRAETELVGKTLSAGVIAKCEAAARAEIAPITDVRASDAYRREVVGVLLRRMLERARGD